MGTDEVRLGEYSGTLKDYTCPEDHATFCVALKKDRTCGFECTPCLSHHRGGCPPWHLEGTWSVDDDEVIIYVTKADMRGPRESTEIKMEVVSEKQLKCQNSPRKYRKLAW